MAKPYGFVADDMRAVFFPPSMVTQDSISASSFVEARGSDGENSLLKKTADVAVTLGGDPNNKNIAGEPLPLVATSTKREWGAEENLVLLVEWPKGFVLKEDRQIAK